MEPRSFVRVLTRIGKVDYRGTGYRVCRNRVLTARHLVADASKIVVELDDKSGDRRRVEARDLPLGDHGLDVALLDLTTDDPVPEAVFAHGPLARPTTWHSRGCPGAAMGGDCVADSMEPFDGKALPTTKHEKRFKLQADNWSQDVTDWQGVSGAPVFVDDRIYGVVSRAPKRFRGRRLDAVPMHLVLRVDGFREALGLTEDDGKWNKALAEIRSLIRADETAARAVAGALASWEGGYESRLADDLATTLGKTLIEDALPALNLAHHELAGEKEKEATGTVEQIARWIVPYLHPARIQVARHGGPGGVLLRLPVATSTVAEIVVAGVEGRICRYLPLTSPDDLPEPEGRVAGTLPTGIDPEDDLAFKEFVDHLTRELIPENRRQVFERQKLEGKRYELAVKAVNGALKWRAGRPDGFRRYFVCDRKFAEEHERLVNRLRSELPELRFVELQGRDDEEVAEWEICYPLAELLYRAQTTRNTE